MNNPFYDVYNQESDCDYCEYEKECDRDYKNCRLSKELAEKAREEQS